MVLGGWGKREKKPSDSQGRTQESSRGRADNHLDSLRYLQTLFKAEHLLSLTFMYSLVHGPLFFSLPPSLGHKFKGENSRDQTVGTRPDFKSDTPFPFSLWAYLWSYVNNLEENRVVTVTVVRGGYGANFARFELDSKCEGNHEFYSENTWFEGIFIWNFEAGTHGNANDISLPLLVLINESELGSYNKLPIVQTSGLWLLFTPDAGRIPVRKCLFPLSYIFTEGSLPPLALVQYLWTEESWI